MPPAAVPALALPPLVLPPLVLPPLVLPLALPPVADPLVDELPAAEPPVPPDVPSGKSVESPQPVASDSPMISVGRRFRYMRFSVRAEPLKFFCVAGRGRPSVQWSTA